MSVEDAAGNKKYRQWKVEVLWGGCCFKWAWGEGLTCPLPEGKDVHGTDTSHRILDWLGLD